MDKQKTKQFVQKIFADMAGAMSAGLCYVGIETGLFAAMAGKGPLQLGEVVTKSGLAERYVEEWLKGMACAGYLGYDPDADTFELPDEHAYMLASEGTDHYAGGLFAMAPVLLGVAPRVARAFRDGGGVPFSDYGTEGIRALDLVNRGNYEHRFTGYWLQALPNVVERLASGGRVLDVGCGAGRAALALALAFPKARIVGIDTDKSSIEQARAAALGAGLDGRIEFLARRTGDFDAGEKFDLVNGPATVSHGLRRTGPDPA